MTEMEREQLRRHEEWISQPVRAIFPKPAGFSRVITCKGCGNDFTWTPVSGKIRMYCTSECRTTYGSSRKP